MNWLLIYLSLPQTRNKRLYRTEGFLYSSPSEAVWVPCTLYVYLCNTLLYTRNGRLKELLSRKVQGFLSTNTFCLLHFSFVKEKSSEQATTQFHLPRWTLTSQRTLWIWPEDSKLSTSINQTWEIIKDGFKSPPISRKLQLHLKKWAT